MPWVFHKISFAARSNCLLRGVRNGRFHFPVRSEAFIGPRLDRIYADVMSIFVPPFGQRDIVCGPVADFPVYLGDVVIDPFF